MLKCLSVVFSKQLYMGQFTEQFIIWMFVTLCSFFVCTPIGFPGTLKDNVLKWITMTKLLIAKLQNCLVFMRKVSAPLYYNMSNSKE